MRRAAVRGLLLGQRLGHAPIAAAAGPPALAVAVPCSACRRAAQAAQSVRGFAASAFNGGNGASRIAGTQSLLDVSGGAWGSGRAGHGRLASPTPSAARGTPRLWLPPAAPRRTSPPRRPPLGLPAEPAGRQADRRAGRAVPGQALPVLPRATGFHKAEARAAPKGPRPARVRCLRWRGCRGARRRRGLLVLRASVRAFPRACLVRLLYLSLE
jgi:hypothetical protein